MGFPCVEPYSYYIQQMPMTFKVDSSNKKALRISKLIVIANIYKGYRKINFGNLSLVEG